MKWVVLGESVAGTAHRARGTPCQDAFRFHVFGPAGEWLVVVVADGAGSASLSEVGATLACDEFARRIERLDPQALSTRGEMVGLFTEVRNAVVANAARLGVPPRELACTALLAVVGPGSAVLAQVGDGAIVLRDGAGCRIAFWPEPSGYANATNFLTDEGFADALHFEAVTGEVTEVAALTDGLQRLALDFAVRIPHGTFFGPLFDTLRSAADAEVLVEPFREFLGSPRVNERTDDDKTLVIAVRRP